MTDTSAIDQATRRLASALDALEAAAEARREADRGADGLTAQLHDLIADRSKLAADLDTAAARTRALVTTNREVARRLDAAIETIRSVLAANGHRVV
jgi:ABC-type transporter Mla subunit MlaD